MLDNEFPPMGGGTGVINHHLLAELATYPDIWIDLVTSSRSRSSYETERFADRIMLYKVPVDNENIHHATNRELLRYGWRGLRLSRTLVARHGYDLSFAFSGVPAGGISYALKRLSGLPYVVSLQGPDVPGFEARYRALYPVITPVLRRIWASAAVVTANSQAHKRLAQDTLPTLDIPVIPNGVDLDIFRPPGQPGASRQTPAVHILCVGRLIERKGQHYLFRALADLRAACDRPLRLTLVGTGDAEASLRRLAVDLAVVELVTFAGFVPRDHVPALYRQADIFVLPSQNEAMSVALLEAMASGLPVVVTQTGGTAELVESGINGYVVPWADVPALAQALGMLVSDERARCRMGAANRQRASQFTWGAMTRQYLDLCRRAACEA